MREARAVRVIRGTLASTLATFVALLSHIAAGADMPGYGGVLTPWVISLLVAIALAGRQLSVVRLSITVVLSQVLFHTLFVLGTGTSSGLAGVPQPGHEGHGVLMLPSTGGSSATLAVDTPMLIAHALAAVVTVVALYRGERSLSALLKVGRELHLWARRQVAAVVSSITAAVQPLVPLRVAFAHELDHTFRVAATPFLSTVVRRGPPARLL